MKSILSLLILLLFPTLSFSAPAEGRWTKLRTQEGTVVNAMLVGDEHGHYYIDDTGRYLLAEGETARFISSVELQSIVDRARQRKQQADARRIRRQPQRSVQDAARSYVGEKKGLVILLEFQDVSFSSEQSKDYIEHSFNLPGFSEDGHIGSVHDYFLSQSYGLFDLKFDVVGPVRLTHDLRYYGANDSYGDDKGVADMATEGVMLADEMGVDFSKYDWDGDGEVDQVYFVYAGYGENTSGAPTHYIWPAEWTLDDALYYGYGSGSFTVDGVRINTFAYSQELHGLYGQQYQGIGVSCHEFSHCLGFPDTYNVYTSGNSGMMKWDIMASGTTCGPNNAGEVPPAFNSFERWMAGWLTPVELTESVYVENMPSILDAPVAYIIYNDANPNEFYMLENHQGTEWDYHVIKDYGTGMLVLHIDYDEQVWYDNEVNADTKHQRVSVIPADNMFSGTPYSYAGDLYPGVVSATALTDETQPSSTLFNANIDGSLYMGKPITDIRQSGGKVSFSFMGGTTGIDDVIVEHPAHPRRFYNYAGQQVPRDYPGLKLSRQ